MYCRKYSAGLSTYAKQHKQSSKIQIVEVGPRDGIQNEKKILTVEQRVTLIEKLLTAGLTKIEVGAFVSPKWVPQMANTAELYKLLRQLPGVSYPCLVPNVRGMETAIELGVKEIAIFVSATQKFSQKNLNCSIAESFERCLPVMQLAKKHNIKVRGYVSMVLGCPYEGSVSPHKVKEVTEKLLDIGCYQVSLGDTVGKGTPETTKQLMNVLAGIERNKLAVHFHDTFGNAIPNILISLDHGIRTVDSSVAGIGGCPYSKTPIGNVCTELVVQALQKQGFETNVDLNALVATGKHICEIIQRPYKFQL